MGKIMKWQEYIDANKRKKGIKMAQVIMQMAHDVNN